MSITFTVFKIVLFCVCVDFKWFKVFGFNLGHVENTLSTACSVRRLSMNVSTICLPYREHLAGLRLFPVLQHHQLKFTQCSHLRSGINEIFHAALVSFSYPEITRTSRFGLSTSCRRCSSWYAKHVVYQLRQVTSFIITELLALSC